VKYRRFEELPVWQAAIDLAVRTFALTARPCFRGHGGTRNQLENAVVSISNNIAEGFERGTTNELVSFIYISRGSAGETRSMFCLLERLPTFKDFNAEIQILNQERRAFRGNSALGLTLCRTQRLKARVTSQTSHVVLSNSCANEKSS
jgi:four helix bundle protein